MQKDVGPCLPRLARSRLSLVVATCERWKGGSGRTLEVWEKPLRAFTGGVAGQSARDRKAFALHMSNASHAPCCLPCCSAVRFADRHSTTALQSLEKCARAFFLISGIRRSNALACTLPDGGCTTADTSWQELSSQHFIIHELSWPIAQRAQDLAYVGMTVGRFFTRSPSVRRLWLCCAMLRTKTLEQVILPRRSVPESYKITQSVPSIQPCDRDALHWFIVPKKQRTGRWQSMGCCFEVCRSGHASTESSASRRSGVSKGGGVGRPTDGLPRSLVWSLDSSTSAKSTLPSPCLDPFGVDELNAEVAAAARPLKATCEILSAQARNVTRLHCWKFNRRA